MAQFPVSADGANQFYGLHALNNLDIAVNGKDVNAMPSYQEVRRRSNANNLDSSGGSAEYSPPQPRDDPAIQCCREFQDSDVRFHNKGLFILIPMIP